MKDDLDIKIDYPDNALETQKFGEDVFGMFKSVTSFPTGTPKNWLEQIVTYRSGGVSQLVIYEVSTSTWKGTIIT